MLREILKLDVGPKFICLTKRQFLRVIFGLSAPRSCDTGINSYANWTFTGFSKYHFESILNYAFFEARNSATNPQFNHN